MPPQHSRNADAEPDPAEPESPIRRMLRLARTGVGAARSAKTRQHLSRVASVMVLHNGFIDVLDAEVVPERICKWVAWGKNRQQRALRLALAIHLRREADIHNPRHATAGWRWGEPHVLGAAERLFWASRQADDFEARGLLAKPPRDAPFTYTAVAWARAWPALLDAVQRSVRADTLRAAAHHEDQQRARRRTRRAPRVRLTPEAAAYVDALDTLKRGVLAGRLRPASLTLGELAEKTRVVRQGKQGRTKEAS